MRTFEKIYLDLSTLDSSEFAEPSENFDLARVPNYQEIFFCFKLPSPTIFTAFVRVNRTSNTSLHFKYSPGTSFLKVRINRPSEMLKVPGKNLLYTLTISYIK